ncbi:MAG: hypothetical protein COA47_05980 [Robiginitomaculum sp.]|nr:MAG: hypothetical protein COA47_05980 [Robiginitomaculum sp.]
MADPRKILKNDLINFFEETDIAFVGRSSFEERSFTAYGVLSNNNLCFQKFFISRGESPRAKELRDKQRLPADTLCELNTDDPLQTQRSISATIKEISLIEKPFSLVVDVTTFRREELLILLQHLKLLPEHFQNNTYFVYSIAAKMGNWLSKNVTQVRPVIGYPGNILIRNKTHLIVCAGIEHHRAKAIIEAYEPESISLGMVPRDKSVASSIFERNLELRNYLIRHFDAIEYEFDFSATDPLSIKQVLEERIKELPQHNIIVAPLNTKLSTLGCGAFAIENPRVQICYAEVEVYNAGDYSEAGKEMFLMPFRDLFT